MTQQDYTALVFVVDRSGSMQSIARDMEGGISALLESQRDLEGTLTVDAVLFDTHIDYIHHLADPYVTIPINPRGSTALYDAVGSTISTFGAALAAMPEEERPGKVIFAIVTDGYENASREYTQAQVKEMVEHQTDVYGWDFMYLGANQDAVTVGTGLGVAAGSSLTYNTANVKGMALAASEYVMTSRTVGAAAFSASTRAANQ